jgi:hypothetical protein
MFSVSRLKRIEKIVCRKMFHGTRLNYTFSKLRKKREVGDRTIVIKVIFIE